MEYEYLIKVKILLCARTSVFLCLFCVFYTFVLQWFYGLFLVDY